MTDKMLRLLMETYDSANGGGDVTLTTLNVSANGTTNAPSGTAYNKVIAAVNPTLTTKTITENGTYSAEDDNADGYSSVTVDVQGSSGYSLIGSGSYIYAGSPTVSLQIPVSYTGSIKYAYCIAVDITGVAHSGCFVGIDDLEFSQYFGVTSIGFVTTVDASDNIVGYVKNDSNRITGNTFELSRAANAYLIQPGTYNWFIYGEANT